MNQRDLFNTDLKIKLTSINGYVQYTNAAKYKVICPGINMLSIKSLYSYIVPETYSANKFVNVLKYTDYVKYTSCTPTSYTLFDA